MSAQALDSFFVELFFKGDPKGAEQFAAQLESVQVAAMKLSTVVVAAGATLMAFVGSVAHNMAELDDFAETNKVSASRLASFGKAAKAVDVDMDQLKSSIAGLNIVTGEAAMGMGKSAMIFQKLGISAKDSSGHVRSVDEMLEVVADKIKGMPRAEQLAILSKLRIDPNMVKVLEGGSVALRKMREDAEKLSLFDDEDFARAGRINKLLAKAGDKIKMLSKKLGVYLFPVVEKILNGFLAWHDAQSAVTSSASMTAFKLIGAAIEVAWGYVDGLTKALFAAVEWLQKFNVITYLAAGALAVYAGVMTSSALSSISRWILKLADALVLTISNTTALGLMAGAVRVLKMALNGLLTGALFFIIDSLVNWALGNKSVIGQLVNEFPMALWALIPVITAITVGWMALNWATISTISSSIAIVALYAASAISAAATIMTAALGIAAAWVIANWPLVLGAIAVAALIAVIYVFWDTIKSAAKSIGDLWEKYVLEPFHEGIDLFNQAKGLLGGSYESQVSVNQSSNGILDKVNAKGGVLGKAEGMGSSSQSSSVNVNGVTMHVTTNDPKVVAQSFESAVRDAVRNSQAGVSL